MDALIGALRRGPLQSFHLVFLASVALVLTPSAASAAWTVPPTPNVAGASSTNLSAVDCVSPGSCMAVGHATFDAPGGTSATVAERWNGTSWQIVPTPNPSGATFSSLNGVSCPRPTICFAVGSSGSPPNSGPLAELWNGTSWSIQSSPAVANGELDAVSCSGLLACTAVGNLLTTNTTAGMTDTLAERWDGTGWQVQSTPNPTGSQDSRLVAVSCPLRRTCTAVGRSFVGSVSTPLVERWFGRVNAWGLQAAPKPDGAENVELNGVSCPNGPVCIAVGSSQTLAGDQTVMAERRIGSKWSLLPIPDPGPASSSDLFAVSCPAPRACHTAGRNAVAERFDGASWQLESVPNPNGLPFPFLAGVSCPGRLFCMAVGGFNFRFSGGTLAAKWTP